jgi:hypothetical protein
MNFNKALVLGIILWILIFFEVSIMMFWLKIIEGNPIYYSLHFIFLSFFVIFLSSYYFRFKYTVRGWNEGLLLGLIFFLVSLILDSIVTIPLFMNRDYSFLMKTDVILGEIWTIVLCAIIGWINKK